MLAVSLAFAVLSLWRIESVGPNAGRPSADALNYAAILDGLPGAHFQHTGSALSPLAGAVEAVPLLLSWPLTAAFGIWGLLASFSLMVSLAAVPLAAIVDSRVRLPGAGILVGVVYLLSLPAWGQLQDAITFGTELAFPLFFFSAYASLLYGRRRAALALFALSAFVHLGYGDLVALLGVLVATGAFPEIGPPRRFGALLIGIGVAPLAVGLLFVQWGQNLEGALGSATAGFNLTEPSSMVWVALAIFAPLAFAPLLAPRWVALLAPFFLLMATQSQYIPALFQSVHVTLFMPFTFLGFTDALRKLPNAARWPLLTLVLGLASVPALAAWGVQWPA